MDEPRVVIDLTRDDFVALNRFLFTRQEKPLGNRGLLIGVGFLLIVILAFLISPGSDLRLTTDTIIISGGLFALLAAFFLVPRFINQIGLLIHLYTLRRTPEENLEIKGTRQYKVMPDCLFGTSDYGDAMMKWEDIDLFEVDDRYIYLLASRGGAHIIPLRYFTGEAQQQAFISACMKALKRTA
ncbi:MAG: YcxB family protein [Candidatus Eremiobacteraeota bacterium]|nr:YcxB family protein [Candidatus Eremiobacteraeota bacterium]